MNHRLSSPLPAATTATGDVIVKLVNAAAEPAPLELNLQGAPKIASTAQLEVLSGQPEAQNTIDNPKNVAPQLSTIENAGPSFTHELPPHSISVLRFHTR